MNTVVVGAQWGDEGKGKIIDVLSESADIVIRFAGGNNAGHTLVVNGQKLVLHLIPSGVLYPDKYMVLGDGMVIDPEALLQELDYLSDLNLSLDSQRLLLSSKAHLILPYHRMLDELRETKVGALGTTKRGIGPTYEDKAARRGLRMGDLLYPERLRSRLEVALDHANYQITRFGKEGFEVSAIFDTLMQQASRLIPHITDTSLFLEQKAKARFNLLFEGAQGVLLDLDHGTYPFVTSSTTLGGEVAGGAGFAPHRIDSVLGVTKAYTTRVGEGPFPSELFGYEGGVLRREGREFGATTGRPRRCGWLDLVALRYAIRVSGIQGLALTKLDILNNLHSLKVCVAYQIGERRVEYFPADIEELSIATPVLQTFKSFTDDLRQIKDVKKLPVEAQQYIKFIEQETETPINLISVGPERYQILVEY
jgi:adenylosuccinate synthase